MMSNMLRTERSLMMKKYFALLQKTSLFYRKLHFSTENFTLLQKTLLHEKYVFYKT